MQSGGSTQVFNRRKIHETLTFRYCNEIGWSSVSYTIILSQNISVGGVKTCVFGNILRFILRNCEKGLIHHDIYIYIVGQIDSGER
jgi:hypothetical protein